MDPDPRTKIGARIESLYRSPMVHAYMTLLLPIFTVAYKAEAMHKLRKC